MCYHVVLLSSLSSVMVGFVCVVTLYCSVHCLLPCYHAKMFSSSSYARLGFYIKRQVFVLSTLDVVVAGVIWYCDLG